MPDAVIVSAVRSAVAKGKPDGALAAGGVTPVDVAAAVMTEAVRRGGVDAREIDDVILGCAMPEASQGLNVARNAALRAGFPVDAAAVTVNRFCSSGLQTVAQATQAVMSGMQDLVVAGGVEMMSQVPMSGYHTRLHPELTESYIGMGFTAERVAERYGVSRADQDAFALESQQKAARALGSGAFGDQIVPIEIEKVRWEGTKKIVETAVFDRDELPRPDTSLEGLAKLRPAFKPTGTVTAGNASPYSDGAAAVVVMNADKAKAMGAKPIARLVAYAVAGIDPDIMGVGPIRAIPKALKKAGMTLDQMDLLEFNEAFAAQALAVARELKMDMSKVNVNGGAIALGHPLGATGAKLTAQLIHELRKRGGGLGMVTMCVGGGMGAAGIFEVYGES
ncbi:MAG: thiolase family protein [Gemmatimonadaceae bacterium]|nr:thiolase family protein [Gemmatimonadaceae bacterium]NUQ91278.1 thiolase family protein [Gemmatimonadaceae bacterium]NUR21072.1 thiolase family protein [Gemmatimonadaceae bacterium]NUS96896.1 thiolase family protein [Gemmatimonadaceae bacterium]